MDDCKLMKIVFMIDLAVHNYIFKLVAVQDKTVKRTIQNFMKTIEFFKSHLRKEYKKKKTPSDEIGVRYTIYQHKKT